MKPGGTGLWRRLYLTGSHLMEILSLSGSVKNVDTDIGNTQLMLLNLCYICIKQCTNKSKNRMSC